MKTYKAALVAHPKGVDQVHHFVSVNRKDYGKRPMKDALLRKLIDWTPACKLVDFNIQSPDETHAVTGFFMAATFFPEMLLFDKDRVLSKITEALVESERLGAHVAALGAFTSIADGRQGDIVAKAATSMAVTNGSTFTSAMTIEGIEQISQTLGLDLRDARLAVIGSTGSIGRTCSRYFMGKTRTLTLTGRNPEKLNRFFGPYRDFHKNLRLTTDNKEAVKDADFIICVTNSITSIFESGDFKPGAVVCDVGFPKNIAAATSDRSDILVYSGGLAKIPGEIRDAAVWGLPSDSIIYGCLCEALIIGMEGRFDLCRVGMDDIPLKNVAVLRQLARENGFSLPPFFNDSRVFSEHDFDKVKRAMDGMTEVL